MSLAARAAVCENTLRTGAFATDVELAAVVGFAAVGVDAASVDMIGGDVARRVLDRAGLRVSSYMALPELLHGDLDELERRLDVAAALSAPVAVAMTGPLLDGTVAAADARCREALEHAAPFATARGIKVALEPMHPIMRRWSYVHTLDHALALVDGIDGAALVLDVGHVWWERDVERFITEHVESIATVQLTNVSTTALDDVRYDRSQLDTGDVPVAALVRRLEAGGYTGWYEHEVLARVPRDDRLSFLRASHEWFESR